MESIKNRHLLGHANLKMATRYVQDVSEQTDRVIENSRKYVIQADQIMPWQPDQGNLTRSLASDATAFQPISCNDGQIRQID